MNIRYCSLLLIVISLMLSCKVTSPSEEQLPSEFFTTSYTGYDADNYARSCIAEDLSSCPNLSPEQEKFAEACRELVDPDTEKKFKVFRCNCSLVLCSDRKKEKKP